MITEQLVAILRCPLDGSRLQLADDKLLASLNRAVQLRTLANRAGDRVERPLEGGLVREAGDLLYPIVDHIPVMLPDEAIDLGALP